MKLRTLFTAAVMAVICSISVSAEEITINTPKCDIDSGILQFSGKVPEYNKSILSILLVTEEQKAEELSDSNLPIDATQVFTDTDGSFDISMYLPADLHSGWYKIIISTGNGYAEKAFSYVSPKEASSFLELVNNVKTPAQAEKIFTEDNLKKIAVKPNEYNAVKNELLLYTPEHGRFNNVQEFIDFFYSIYAINMVKNGNVSEALELYSNNLGIGYKDYIGLNSTEKSKLDMLLTEYGYKDWNFKDVFEQLLILARVQAAQKWSELKEIIIKYKDILGVNMSSKSTYDTLKNKDAVFAAMYKKEYHVYSDIKNAFDTAVAEQKAIENKNSSGSNAGGGAGGGTGGGSSVSGIKTGPQEIAEKTASIEAQTKLKDISDHWAKDIIIQMFGRGIISGYPDGCFKPDNSVTRAEFAAIASKIIEEKSGKTPFEDVSEDYWAYKFISNMYLNGLVSGDGTNFYPDEPITREDAAVIIYRIIKMKGSMAISFELPYKDSNIISDYAADAIASLSAAGILNGDETGCFRPNSTTSRAEAAAMIYKISSQTN